MATYWENSCSFGLRYVSWYKYLIVSLVFSHLGFWSGNLFLIAPFPDLCLLVPFHTFFGNLQTADNYTSAIYILIRQVISKNRFIFSMQISFQNLTSCRGREKDRLHDHTKYLFLIEQLLCSS